MSDASDYVDAKCQVCNKYFDFCLITTSYEEAGLAKCHQGHCFCTKHCPAYQPSISEEGVDEEYSDPTDIPCKDCPICKARGSTKFVEKLEEKDLLLFLLKEKGLTESSLKASLKKRFKTGEEFFAFIK